MIFVVFPAFNEERAIGSTLAAAAAALRGRESEYHVVLVDDGSSDGTVAHAEQTLHENGDVLPFIALRHEVNRGLGAALRTGIYWCLDRATEDDLIVILEADNTHPPSLIPAVVERLRSGCDVVIVSRYRAGSEVHGVPAYRRALSDFGRFVFQGLFPIPGVRDYTCCFRGYRVSLLRRGRALYGDDLCAATGFEAVMDLLLKLRPLAPRAAEIPFVLEYGERAGQSRMKVLKTIRTTLFLLARRFIERFTSFSRPRVLARLKAAERNTLSTPAPHADPRLGGNRP